MWYIASVRNADGEIRVVGIEADDLPQACENALKYAVRADETLVGVVEDIERNEQ